MPKYRRVFALLLTLAALLSVLPTAALAAEEPEEPVAPAVQGELLQPEPEAEEAATEEAQEVLEPVTEAPQPATEAPQPATEAPQIVTEAPAEETVDDQGPGQNQARSGSSFTDPIVIQSGERVENTFPLGGGADKDYYKLTLNESGTLSILGASDTGIVHLAVYNSKRKEIWGNDVDLQEGEALELTGDTYFLVINKLGDGYGDYHFTATLNGAGETYIEKPGSTNDTRNTATSMKLDTRTVGHLSITDETDWYTFDLSKSGRLTFASTTRMEELYFVLSDARGNIIWSRLSQSNHSTGENKISNLVVDVSAGTYYLRAEKSNEYAGKYIFQMNYVSSEETFPESPGGSNNSRATANVVASNTVYNGQLAENDTVDFYRFTISDAKVSITFQASTKLPKVRYIICNKSGKALKSIESGWVNAGTPGTVNESVPLAKGTYYLKVTSGGTSTGNYSFQFKTSAMFVPVVKKLTNQNGSILVEWDDIGAPRYRVFVKKGTKWNKVGDTTQTSTVFQKPEAGKSYTFTIRAVSKDGKQFLTDYDPDGMTIVYVAPPTITGLTNTVDGVKVVWKAEPGAENYQVFFRPVKGKWKNAGTTTGTSLVVKKVLHNTEYQFTVRACTADGKSYTSEYDRTGKSIVFLQPPVVAKLQVRNDGILVSWDRKTGIQKVRIFYRKKGGKWKKLADTSRNSYVVNTLPKGETYYFTLRGLDNTGKRCITGYDTGMGTEYLAPPVVTSVSQSAEGVLIKWEASKGVKQYRVLYKEQNGPWKTLATVKTNTCLTTKLKAKTKYTFTVRCLSADGKRFISGYDPKGRSITTK